LVSNPYTILTMDYEISFTEQPYQQKGPKLKHARKEKITRVVPPSVVPPTQIDIENLKKDAQLKLAKGEYNDALQLLEKALQISPNDFEALSLQGYIYVLQENFQESIRVLSKAFSINCADFSTFYNLQISQIKANNIFDGVNTILTFLKCSNLEDLDKNKMEKINSLLSILEKKTEVLKDNNSKTKLQYMKNVFLDFTTRTAKK
jgi:tetratricopeptide (TPR) repeat protein